jgi:hypothetical protein
LAGIYTHMSALDNQNQCTRLVRMIIKKDIALRFAGSDS